MTWLRRIPSFAKEALLFELALYRSLARWIARRPDVPHGSVPIGYSRLVAPMLWLWIYGSAIEVVVVEVVLRHIDQPWAEAVGVPILVLGVWGVLWMLGMLASYRVRPHLLTDNELVLRSGARTWLAVPRPAVASIRTVEHDVHGLRSLQVDRHTVLVGVGNRTNLELVLTEPMALPSSKGFLIADRVGMWVDEPREVLAQLGVSAHRG